MAFLSDQGNHQDLNKVYVDGVNIPVAVESLNGQIRVRDYRFNVEGFGKTVTAAKFHFTTQYRERVS